MIDIKALRANPQPYIDSCSARGVSFSPSSLLELDDQVRQLKHRMETDKATQNEVSKRMPTLSGPEKAATLEEMKALAEGIKTMQQELHTLEEQLQQTLCAVPALLHADVPHGKDETENTILRTVGTPPQFAFTPKEHWELGIQNDLIDLERGAKVSGSRFYFLKGNLFLLHRALQQYALDTIIQHGFTPVMPPYLVREQAMYGTGFFPADRNEIYTVNPGEDELYLIGTAEVPLMSYHSDEILEETSLPRRYVGVSPCFRREAGSYGKDTKGILRVHQFEKVEMVTIATPDQSETEHELILSIEESIFQGLALPYRVVVLCSGDIGFSSSKTYDIEAWMPGQDTYREITSTSNCTDFQTRRLKVRYKDQEGQNQLTHGINGTGTAMRTLIAIMENYQQADGTIAIPTVLQPYMGGRTTL